MVSAPVTEQRESGQAQDPAKAPRGKTFCSKVFSHSPGLQTRRTWPRSSSSPWSLVGHTCTCMCTDNGMRVIFSLIPRSPPTAGGQALYRIQCILILPRDSVGAPLPAQVRKEAPHVLPHPYFHGSGLHPPSGLCWSQGWSESGEADSGVYFLTEWQANETLNLAIFPGSHQP